ncbi:MAG: CIA30 family protein [Tateyamaria sp.]
MTRWALLLSTLCLSGMAQAEPAKLTPKWEYVADTVMGGVSSGQASHETVLGRDAIRLTGTVSLDNNGGFIQIAFDLANGAPFDASAFSGIEVDVTGNGQTYDLRLRTSQLTRPWQSFRASFVAPADWTTVRFPFDTFEAHRTDAAFDPAQLRRVGVLAIGREITADVSISGVRFY